MPYRVAGTEFARLSALYRCGVLDTAADPAFDHVLGRLAADLDVPVAQLVFADAQRFWAKSSLGAVAPENARGRGPLERLVIEGAGFLAIEDAAASDAAPLAGPPSVRSFAGMRVVGPEEDVLGVIYIGDARPNAFGDGVAARLATAVAEVQALLAQGRREREDEATGALRREAFLDQSRRLMAVTRAGRQWISLVTLDLAPFLSTLDGKSSGLGRLALHQMADLGRTQVRRRDCFGRLSQDVFAVLLTDTGEAGAKVLAQRLTRHLERGWTEAGLGLAGARLGSASLRPVGAGDEIGGLLARAMDKAGAPPAPSPVLRVA